MSCYLLSLVFFLAGCGFIESKKVNIKATLEGLDSVGEFGQTGKMYNRETGEFLVEEKQEKSTFKGQREVYSVKFQPKQIRDSGKPYEDQTRFEKDKALFSTITLVLFQFPENEDGLNYFKERIASGTAKLTETSEHGGIGFDWENTTRGKINCFSHGFCYEIIGWTPKENDEFIKIKLLTRAAFVSEFIKIKDEKLVYYD